MANRIVKVLQQNIGKGAVRGKIGAQRDKLPDVLERINAAEADVVVLNEVKYFSDNGHERQAAVAQALDMEPLPLAPAPSGNGVAVFYKAETLARWRHWNTDYGEMTHHGYGLAAWEVGLPRLFGVMACHLIPMSPTMGLGEAELVGERAHRYSLDPSTKLLYSVIAGDINYPPENGPEANWEKMMPHNRAARFREPLENPPRNANTDVARMLRHYGYTDAAAYLADRDNDQSLLAPTGKTDRIDSIYVGSGLLPALVAYERLTEPAEASDHHGVAVTLDLTRLT